MIRYLCSTTMIAIMIPHNGVAVYPNPPYFGNWKFGNDLGRKYVQLFVQ